MFYKITKFLSSSALFVHGTSRCSCRWRCRRCCSCCLLSSFIIWLSRVVSLLRPSCRTSRSHWSATQTSRGSWRSPTSVRALISWPPRSSSARSWCCSRLHCPRSVAPLPSASSRGSKTSCCPLPAPLWVSLWGSNPSSSSCLIFCRPPALTGLTSSFWCVLRCIKLHHCGISTTYQRSWASFHQCLIPVIVETTLFSFLFNFCAFVSKFFHN